MRQPSAPSPFLRALVLGYAVLWIAAAISPRSWPTWLLENVPVVAAVGVLVATYARFAFSNLSYLLIATFFALHAIGAHTGYAHSPAGDWLESTFDLKRNYYDRIVHCAFGLLLAFPARELLDRSAHVSRRAAAWYSVCMIVAASSAFEVLEALLAETVSPGTGPDWVGAQGDEWDAQLDMLVASVGAAVTALATSWSPRLSAIASGARP